MGYIYIYKVWAWRLLFHSNVFCVYEREGRGARSVLKLCPPRPGRGFIMDPVPFPVPAPGLAIFPENTSMERTIQEPVGERPSATWNVPVG